MTKLSEKERKGFEKILEMDLRAINEKFYQQIKVYWGIARNEVLKKKGWDVLIEEKERLVAERSKIINRIHEIEEIMNDKGLKIEQIVELGGKPNEYGRYSGAKYYGIPITSQLEYEIVEYIRANITLEIPAKILRDLCESSVRALTMAGSFEEARTVYDKFYSLDFRAYGVDIPPRLDEMCEDKQTLLCAQQSLKQIE